MDWALLLGIANIACGVVIFSVCIPLLMGKIRRNLFYGVRVAQSFRSEEAWLAINRYGAKRFMIWSALLTVFGVLVLFLSISSTWAIMLVALAPTAMLIPALESTHFARQIDTTGRGTSA